MAESTAALLTGVDLVNLGPRRFGMCRTRSRCFSCKRRAYPKTFHHYARSTPVSREPSACDHEFVRRDGVIGLMLYAQHGRFGVYLLQSVFRELGLRQDEASLRMVKEAISLLPADHPFKSYMNTAPDFRATTPVWWIRF